MATKLYQNNVDEQIIMEITGHRSMAVRSYKRTSERQRKEASKCIFGELWALNSGGTPRQPFNHLSIVTFRDFARSLRPLWWHPWLLYCYVLLSSVLLIQPWPCLVILPLLFLRGVVKATLLVPQKAHSHELCNLQLEVIFAYLTLKQAHIFGVINKYCKYQTEYLNYKWTWSHQLVSDINIFVPFECN